MSYTSHTRVGTIAARAHDDLVVTTIGTLDAIKTPRGVPCDGRSSVVLSTRFEGVTYRAETISAWLYEPMCWPDVADHEIEIDGRTYDAQINTPLPRPVKLAFDAALSGIGAWMAAWGVTAEMADEWGEDRLEDCEVSDSAKHDSRELSTAVWLYDQEAKS